jgi:hypothetical protein
MSDVMVNQKLFDNVYGSSSSSKSFTLRRSTGDSLAMNHIASETTKYIPRRAIHAPEVNGLRNADPPELSLSGNWKYTVLYGI